MAAEEFQGILKNVSRNTFLFHELLAEVCLIMCNAKLGKETLDIGNRFTKLLQAHFSGENNESQLLVDLRTEPLFFPAFWCST